MSKRQMEMIKLMADGYSNQQIAEKLGLSINTVKSYSLRIYDLLGAIDRTHAVAISFRRGILEVA